MKHKAALLLTLPLLLFSSCETNKVSYNTFVIAAKEADQKAEAITIEQKTIDGSGSMAHNDVDHKFSFHEEYHLGENGSFVLDENTAKYECDDLSVFTSVAIYSMLAVNLKASTVALTSGQVFMTNPLTVQELGSKTIFDDYGYPVEIKVTGLGTNYTLKVTYTYKE